MSFNKWFDTFLEEKNIGYKAYEIEHAVTGEMNFIDSDVVIEAIKGCGTIEQDGIKNTLVNIDFQNGSVHHFFEHLASALVHNS